MSQFLKLHYAINFLRRDAVPQLTPICKYILVAAGQVSYPPKKRVHFNSGTFNLYFSLKPSKHWMLFNTVHVQKNSLPNTLNILETVHSHIPFFTSPNTFGMIIFPGTFTEHLFTTLLQILLLQEECILLLSSFTLVPQEKQFLKVST